MLLEKKGDSSLQHAKNLNFFGNVEFKKNVFLSNASFMQILTF